MSNMSNVIIQKINLYDLELQGNSSSDEEEENIAKNQQKQPSIATFLTKKSPRQQRTENGVDKLIECEIGAESTAISSLEVSKSAKSPNSTLVKKSSNLSTPKIGEKSSPSQNSIAKDLNPMNKSSAASSNTSPKIQPKVTKNATSTLQTPPELFTDFVIKEELIDFDENQVIQQTWQDLDQHTFIKQENELMVPPDSLDGENIMEDEIEEQDLRNMQAEGQEIENSQKLAHENSERTTEALDEQESSQEPSDLSIPLSDSGVLDEKFGFFFKGSENSHKSIEQLDEDIMTSQDIPVDFENDMTNSEGNPPKRIKIDERIAPKIPHNVARTQENLQNVSKINTNLIVKTLPKGITVKRTSGRQVACKSTSFVANKSPNKSLDENTSQSPNTNGKVMAKIGENLTKIGETFVKFGKNIDMSVKNPPRLLPTLENSQEDDSNVHEGFRLPTIKDEPIDKMELDQQYADVYIEKKDPTNEPEKVATNAELAKSFTKNIGIVNKVGEIANQIVGRIIGKRGDAASQAVIKLGQNSSEASKHGVSPQKFGLDPKKVGGNFVKVHHPQTSKSSPSAKVIISTKVIQNPVKIIPNSSSTPQRLSMPSTSYFMPTKFLDIPIKEEKIDDDENGIETSILDTSNDPSNHLVTKIKEEDQDEYFTSYTPKIIAKPLNSTVTSTSETIVSTKVVTLPASNLLKTRKIIVIKKPVTPGSKPSSGHSIQRALKSQMRITPGTSRSEPENTRYIIKTVSMPNKTIKTENSPKSSLQISSISSAQNQGSPVIFKTITYPKSEPKVVNNHSDAIYRCFKCHLLFSSHSEYTDHLKEHRIPQGIVFNEKRVIKLEELQKMNAFQCAQCSAGFPTLEKLSAHENRHKTEFCCKYCGMTFLQQFRYKEHLLLHEKKKEKYLECNQCDKKFLKQVRLDEHVMNAHAVGTAYSCSYCESKFATATQLQEHQRTTHTKKAPMKCGLCNYETYVKQNFEKHASMHMRYVEKLNSNQFFKCDQCPQSFREQGVLEMHKQHMHS